MNEVGDGQNKKIAVRHMYWDHLAIFKSAPGRSSLKGVYATDGSFQYLLLLAGLAVAVWFIWGFIGVQSFHAFICARLDDSCNNGLSDLGAVGDIFGGVNALFAAMALLASVGALVHTRKTNDQERRLNHDGEFTKQIQNCYQWAFETIREDSGVTLNAGRWSEASLRLLNAELLFEALHSSVYKVIAAEHRRYWRHQFQLLLKDSPGEGVAFFFSVNERKDGEIVFVDPRAAYIVGDFAFGYVSSGDLIEQIKMPRHCDLAHLMPSDFGKQLEKYLDFLERRGDARVLQGRER